MSDERVGYELRDRVAILSFDDGKANVISPDAAADLNAALDRAEKEAGAVVRDLLDTHPGFNLSQWEFGRLWKSEEDRTRLYDAAKRAGIPEFPRGD